MHSLISLVSYNHMDNYLKEILVYVYLGAIVNNQPKMAENFQDVSSHVKQQKQDFSSPILNYITLLKRDIPT